MPLHLLIVTLCCRSISLYTVNTMPNYLPVEQRTPDSQYQDLLSDIMENGRNLRPIQGERAKMVPGAQMRFKMENGFPIINERDLSGNMFNGALAEHIAFLNGARTQEELEAFGCKWWERWVTEEKCATFGLEPGDLGPGSYGAGWTNFPTAEGEPFDQIEHVVRQIKERPYLRTHEITPWIPQYTIQHSELDRKVVVAPCHGWIHVLAFPDDKEFVIVHKQRSGDIPVGVPFNLIEDYTFTEIVYNINDAHIYESQYEKVGELIKREPRTLGTVTLKNTLDNIKDYRPDDFDLSDYFPHKRMLIPTPT
jgi:thymidylate synthase